jgi:hypothetical protein
VLPAARELEMRIRSRHSQKDAVVACMVFEAADLRETEAVAIKPNDLRELVCMPCDTKLHQGAAGIGASSGIIRPAER